MVASIPQVIGKINPHLYADNGEELLKKYGTPSKIDAEKVKDRAVEFIGEGKINTKGIPLEGQEVKHKLIYDSSTDTLEPIYFFILDLMNDFGINTQKLVDNFSSSPGSGHFSELGQKKSIMQQNASKVMGDINTVLRSILNLIYDLRDFRIRLQSYEDLKEGDKEKKDAALLSLKQIWMDKVDIQKGNSSIKSMALSQAGFVTLIDAFLAAKTQKDVDNLDLNQIVKRVLKPRLAEFNTWLKESESELRKRYEMEKTYLKSQVASLKTYTRWARPYLIAAQKLQEDSDSKDPSLVSIFNTIMLELTLLGRREFKPDLPKGAKTTRKYYECVLVDFYFRGIPQRVQGQQHFAFGGRAEVTFRGYILNEEELAKFDAEMKDSDLNIGLRMIEGITEDSLGQLEDDIKYFIGEEALFKDKNNEENSSKKDKDTSNPFLALLGIYDKKEKSKDKKDSKEEDIKNKPIKKDSWTEKTFIRNQGAEAVSETTWTIFDIYKKGHGMASW
jgi:hypothetical protein